MSLYVIEGTWEEIERRKAELIGRQLRVTIKLEKPMPRKPSEPAKTTEPKKLVGFGAFKGMTGGSEAFAAEKRAAI
jgi:hypothetical protein